MYNLSLQTPNFASIENCLLSGQAEVLVRTVPEHEEVMLVEVVQPGHGPHLQLGEVELGQLPRAATAAHVGHWEWAEQIYNNII